VATLTTSSLATGTNIMTVDYSGDNNFLAATSPALTQLVPTGACATPPGGIVNWWAAEGNANDLVEAWS
jgi:hypothetical protein